MDALIFRPMTPARYPTPWQRKTFWAAIAAVSVVAIGAIGVGLIWLVSLVLGFLQPILIPFAVAGVMAYLLDPLVEKIVSWGTTRPRAVIAVFAVVTLALVGILVWIVPAISTQSGNFARKVPRYTAQVKTLVTNFAKEVEERTGFPIFKDFVPAPAPPPDMREIKELNPPSATAEEAETESLKEPPEAVSPGVEDKANPVVSGPKLPQPTTAAELRYDWNQLISGRWAQDALPTVVRKLWDFVTTSVGGFLGIFGFVLSMIIVPVYLYYFLIESRNIAEGWQDYVPLRASHFKDEVIETLDEINGYLIAFFRGQLVVSLINGTATGLGLMVVGLDFGLLIGLLLCVLGLIPYLGIILCWIPAVIIASVQGDLGTWIPANPWWVFPLVVTGIFVVVQQVDGLFITPKIVGESVGLHPMTVIVSVFVWSLLMGGLLGAILAVPMTATLKVILKRYVWDRRFRVERGASTEEEFSELQAQTWPAESVRMR